MKDKKIKKEEKNLLKSIKSNFSKLKKYDRLETKEEIQIIKYDVPVEYFNFKEAKVINYYNPYAIMMGVIDGFIDKRLKEISLYKNNKTIYRYEMEIKYAKKVREEICDNMLNTEYKLLDEDKHITQSIRTSILNHPAHTNFSNIYEEGKNSKYNNVYIEFIRNYNNGYSLAADFKSRDVMYIYVNYKHLFKSLYEKYTKNEKRIYKVKTKEHNKRYPNY